MSKKFIKKIEAKMGYEVTQISTGMKGTTRGIGSYPQGDDMYFIVPPPKSKQEAVWVDVSDLKFED